MAMGNHDIRLSKALSNLLRHNMINQGLRPTSEGFVFVEDVLKLPRFQEYTFEAVKNVVEFNDKKRFSLKRDDAGKWMIGANQGHSIKGIDPDLKSISDPSQYPVVLHGTYMRNWYEGIREKGLNRMNRNHIHFAQGEPGEGGVLSGMRRDCNVFIYINLESALNDGFQFFESANKVILCPGNDKGFLPLKYFSKVLHKDYKGKEHDLLAQLETSKT